MDGSCGHYNFSEDTLIKRVRDLIHLILVGKSIAWVKNNPAQFAPGGISLMTGAAQYPCAPAL